MSDRALLIGAELDGLTGVAGDIDAMTEALGSRGFTVDTCAGQQATRAGILAAYNRLIEVAGPGDAAVVYYSGHGGLVAQPDDFPRPDQAPRPDLMAMQFIAPVDYHDVPPDDFGGITSVELSVLLARLTQKTNNATVILDCCHAAHMSRTRDLQQVRVRALSRLAPYDHLRSHIAQLKAEGVLPTDLLVPTGIANAVRITACAADQFAIEYRGEGGRQIGILTEALTMALAEAGSEPVTWATVMDRVRHRVLTLVPAQRPDAEGPARRLLFSSTEDDPLTTLRVTSLARDRVRLECAPLLGVSKGDGFAIMPPGRTLADSAEKVGDLLIDRAVPLAAEGTVKFCNGQTSVPLGARAHRVTAVASAIPVRLPDQDARSADLADAVSAAPMLRLAGRGEPHEAAVGIDAAGDLTVSDRIGPLAAPRPGNAGGVAQVIRDLNALAQASALRSLAGDAAWALRAPVTVDWGLVQDGCRRPAPGGVVRPSDRIYVSIRNDGDSEIFVSLIDIGVASRITVLTRWSPAGVKLAPGKEYVFGFDDFEDVLYGVSPTWPAGLDTAQSRPETVLLLVTAAPLEISMLEQDGVSRGALASPLQRTLSQIATGHVRDLAENFRQVVRYDVHPVNFDLEPRADAGSFLIDERPNPRDLLLTARGLEPVTLAVRMEELIVHRNRAAFGADIRVDAIVLTGSDSATSPSFQARTERFSRIRDDEALPLDRMLASYGPAADYLDIAIWVSRDRSGSRDLGDLITAELASFEMQDALAKISATMMSAPYAAATTAAIGVGAVVVNVAYKLLRNAASDVIGLYRGSMLAHEGFGVGRHPASGTRRVQDFSLAYSIANVD